MFPFVQSPNGLMVLHPIYEDEEERCYFRRRASVQAVSMTIAMFLERLNSRKTLGMVQKICLHFMLDYSWDWNLLHKAVT